MQWTGFSDLNLGFGLNMLQIFGGLLDFKKQRLGNQMPNMLHLRTWGSQLL